nr:hypothetical protein [uncultured Methanoregula sp.]
MSSYDSKKLVSKPILDTNLDDAWKIICQKLGNDGEDFRIVSLHPKKKLGIKWFHASASNENSILITRPNDPEKKSGIKRRFRFVPWDFEKDANLYNEYVSGKSCEIRHTGSHTSSYVITLIAELL